jgi:hypothetical protein
MSTRARDWFAEAKEFRQLCGDAQRCERASGVAMDTKYKRDCDAFRASALFRTLTNPDGLGTTPEDRRFYLSNRIMDAFEEGWSACDLEDNGASKP